MLDLLWADDEQTEMLLPPHVYNFDAIGYNPTQVDDVSTWSALFDDQYSGRWRWARCRLLRFRRR